MKKLICLMLILCLLPVIALADFDLSSMSIGELRQLQQRINAEIITRAEWKEVEVPAGEWIIGEDIPEGYYSIRATDKIAIVEAAPPESKLDDFYHVLGKGEEVGKVLFVAGSIFKTSSTVILAPPKGLGF